MLKHSQPAFTFTWASYCFPYILIIASARTVMFRLSLPSRFTFVPSLSMTQPKTTSFPVRRPAFASEWGTLFRSSPRTTTTGGRESWRTLRTGRQASFHPQSYRSGKEQPARLLSLLHLFTLMLMRNIMAYNGKSKGSPLLGFSLLCPAYARYVDFKRLDNLWFIKKKNTNCQYH